MRVIGDVHGKFDKYIELANEVECSLQLGDMSFDYRPLEVLDSKKHKFFPGNHDNYYTCDFLEHSLGHYGLVEHGGITFFYIRGAFSIDWKRRVIFEEASREPKTWWENEQLSFKEMIACEKEYLFNKPSIVITHTCPQSAVKGVTTPSSEDTLKRYGYNPSTFSTNTQQFLQHLFEQHQPDLWIFGHFHVDRQFNVGNTKFVCLPELGFIDL